MPLSAQTADAPAPAAAAAASDAAHQPSPAPAADAHAQPPVEPAHGSDARAAAGQEHGAGAEHAESPWGLVARIVNFLILAGGIAYFVKTPIAQYLAARGQQIRAELVTARETTDQAKAQLAVIDQKLKALPAEIEALKVRGAEEVAAEGARIREQAEAERHRLLEQTRRDVDLQVRLARQALTEHAADLAVQLAADRLKATITADDQARLIDRYVANVKEIHG